MSEDQSKLLETNPLEHGPQPIAALLERLHLTNHQIVAASTEQVTHKMMAKACRGRFLSSKVRQKILRAVNAASGGSYNLGDLFNYR